MIKTNSLTALATALMIALAPCASTVALAQTAPATPAPAATAPAPVALAPADATPAAPALAAAPTTEAVDNPYGLDARWRGGDFVSRGTLIILVIMSVGTWYIMIIKV